MPPLLFDLAPVAVIHASADDGTAPFTVQLDGIASYDTDGGPLSFAWNPGDGSPEKRVVAISHTYYSPGQLTVRMTVRDSGGLESAGAETNNCAEV
jgi:PKD repeat protein